MSNNNPNYRRDRRERNDGYMDMLPPNKRPRQYDRPPNTYHNRGYPNYNNNNNVGGGNFPYQPHYPSEHYYDPAPSAQQEDPNRMKSFKQFISKLHDSVTEEDAANKYKEYKIEFKRNQARQFFDKYKEQEWFIEKYRPPQLQKRLKEQRQSRKKRLETFMELIEHDSFKDLTLHYRETESRRLELFLDSVIVKLEGGTDDDLRLLSQDAQYRIPSHMKKISEEAEKLKLEQPIRQNDPSFEDPNSAQPIEPDADNNDDNNEVRIKEEDEGIDCDDKPSCSREGPIDQPRIKVEDEENAAKDNEEESVEQMAARQAEVIEEDNENPTLKSRDLEENPTRNQVGTFLHKTSSVFIKNLNPNVTKEDIVAYGKQFDGFLRVAMSEAQPPSYYRRAWVTYRYSEPSEIRAVVSQYEQQRDLKWLEGAKFAINKEIKNRIRPVSGYWQHKMVVKADIQNAVSIITYLDKQRGIWQKDMTDENSDTLPSNNDSVTEKLNEEEKNKEITIKQEEETAVANITEPDPQTQDPTIDNKKNETNQPMETNNECPPDQENKSTTEPMNLDEEGEGKNIEHEGKNPLLEDIEQYLVEELNIEEHELVGNEGDVEGEAGVELSRDENLERVLDKLLLYLRVVHSVDYYNVSEYVGEDDMPTRIGLMFTRGAYHTYRQNVTAQDIKATIRNHQSRLKHLTEDSVISEAELKQLGKIDVDALIEEFIEKNSVSIGPERWMCTVSQKKFKSKEFVRKHILNRKNAQVAKLLEEIEMNSNFFNNYLADPKRPTDIVS